MPDLTSGQYSTSLLNQNFADQTAEFLDVLYRNNSAGRDNAMQNELDMNANRILNLPDAIQNSEPITLGQAAVLAAGSNPLVGYFDNAAIWLRAKDQGAWNPSGLTQSIIVSFIQNTIVTATHTIEGVLNSTTGDITVSTSGTTGSISTLVITNNISDNPQVQITHVDSGVISNPIFLSIQGGTSGTAGTPGADGTASTQYYIKPLTGTAIKNGVGTLTVEAHLLTGSSDTELAAGSIQLYVGSTVVTVANGYATGSNGYTGVFDTGDISDSVLVELKDGPSGTVLDSITLIDVEDGVASNATSGSIESTNGLAWTRLPNAGAWAPTALTTDLICTFYQAGTAVATETQRVTLNSADGILTAALQGTDDGNIAVTYLNSGTTAITIQFVHSPTGVRVSETVLSAQSGSDGATGDQGSDGTNGTNGVDGEFYYIKPTAGTAIANGTGNLTIEAHHVTGAADVLLSSGTIVLYDPSNDVVNIANGYVTGSDGYTGILDSGDIAGDIVITLKDGTGGTVLDTITLVDVIDGVASNATSGSITSDNGLVWNRATNSGAWNPSTLTTDLTATFYQGGSQIAQEVSRVTLDAATGTLTHATQTDHAGVTVSVTGGGTNGLTIEFTHTGSGHVVAETVAAIQSGSDGVPGTNASQYYIKPTNGTAISNGTGTLTLEAHFIDGASDTLLSTGTIQLYVSTTLVTVGNGYAGGSNGYTGVFDSTDINGSVVVELKDGSTGTVLDTITLVDVLDGIGTDAVTGSVNPTNGLAWSRAVNAGAWTPTGTTTDLVCTFYQGGSVIATETRRVTLNTSTGVLTTALTGTNHADITVSVSGASTSSVTVEFTHVPSGILIAENVISVQSGSDGSNGDNGSSGAGIIRDQDNIGLNGSTGSVTLSTTGAQVSLSIVGGMVGFTGAQGPSTSVLRIRQGTTTLSEITHVLTWSFESEIGTWSWVSNINNSNLTALHTPGTGNTTYTSQWTAGSTAAFPSAAGSPILTAETVQ